MKKILFITFITLLSSCSSKNQGTSGGIDLTNIDETPIEEVASSEVVSLDESNLLSKEEIEISASSMFENAEQYASSSSVIVNDATPEEIIIDDENEDREEETLQVSDQILKPSEIDENIPETVEYVVQKNETLMLIAHKLYGDYKRWKQIQEVNGNLLFHRNMREGSKILVPTPDSSFSPSHRGTAYLIQSGDTLGKVSNHAYNTPKHWKYVWKNNKDVIKDPHLIFAGFTLYYLPLEKKDKRDLASDPEAEL